MSLLVRCETCKVQYDASGRAVGSRFRCHCGVVLTVTDPVNEATSAVHVAAPARAQRCSGCGAPRSGDALACHYCHADFSLHERDLNTVCRACFTRVSDRAQFCGHCGESLAGEQCVALATDLECPSCSFASASSSVSSPASANTNRAPESAQSPVQLQARTFATETTILECPSCAGMWLRNPVIKDLLQGVHQQAQGERLGAQGAEAQGPRAALRSLDHRPAHAAIYRRCPDCGEHMRRHIFAKSGIIIDSCKNHGVWFDADELDEILNWVRAGGSLDTGVTFEAEGTGTAGFQYGGKSGSQSFRRSQQGPRSFKQALGEGLVEVLEVLGDALSDLFADHRRR